MTLSDRAASLAVVVLAKRPIAGRVKTRMVPPLTYAEAADLAAAALRDTLRVVDAARFARSVLSFDSDPTGWLPLGWVAHRQPQGGLDRRIVAALQSVTSHPVVLVGMDTPQLSAMALLAFDPVGYDACLGLATDGGYWAIGFADSADAARCVPGVPMSLPTTGVEQLRRMRAAGLRVQLLEELTDVDTLAVAREVASDAEQTEFAAMLRAVLAEPVR